MNLVEYKFWRFFAFLGLLCWVAMPFINIKFFGVSVLGYASFLLFLGIFYSRINRQFLTYRLSYLVSIVAIIVLAMYWNLLHGIFLIVAPVLMMSVFVFALAYIEKTPISDD